MSRILPFYDEKTIFSNNFNEQKEQLKNNKILRLFYEERKKQKSDSLKPIYHFTSPIRALNDPNGLCYWNGLWHLFYQFIVDNKVYWGHTISPDMINWRDLPPAIYPCEEYCCWSGATCVEEDRVIAMYYGFPEGLMIAVSSDPLLLNWTRLQREPVIKVDDIPKEPKTGYSVPDPFIWKEDGKYYALIGGIKKHQVSESQMRQAHLYSSNDLYNWEFIKEFFENDEFGETNDDGACPYFMKFGERHLVMHFSHRHGARYLLGKYNKNTHSFLPINGGALSHDCWFGGVHAPSMYPYEDGMAAIFNTNCSEFPVKTDNQMLTLPRKYTLAGKNKDMLSVNVLEECNCLREEHYHFENMEIPANKEVWIKEISSRTMEFIAEFEPERIPVIEIKVLCSDDNSEYTKIQFYHQRSDRVYDVDVKYWGERKNYKGVLILDASHASQRENVFPPPPVREDVFIQPEENIKIRVFVDNSIVEVYVNDCCAAAIRAYPSNAGSNNIKISAIGKDAKLLSLDAWKMKSIY